MTYAYDSLITNPNMRHKFFKELDRLIQLLKRHGLYDATRIYLKFRDQIQAEIDRLCSD